MHRYGPEVGRKPGIRSAVIPFQCRRRNGDVAKWAFKKASQRNRQKILTSGRNWVQLPGQAALQVRKDNHDMEFLRHTLKVIECLEVTSTGGILCTNFCDQNECKHAESNQSYAPACRYTVLQSTHQLPIAAVASHRRAK